MRITITYAPLEPAALFEFCRQKKATAEFAQKGFDIAHQSSPSRPSKPRCIALANSYGEFSDIDASVRERDHCAKA